MSANEWWGWYVGDSPALHIGRLPGRKSVCLYRIDGSELLPLAYFRSEEAARIALSMIDELAGLR